MPFLYREFSDNPFKRSGCFLFGKVFLDALGKTEADLQAIWNNAVKEGAKAVNVKTAENNKKAANEGGVKESSRDIDLVDTSGVIPATEKQSLMLNILDARNLSRYYNDVTSVLNGNMSSNRMLLIGKPPAIIQKYLKSNNPLYMPQSIVRKVVFDKNNGGKHGLGRVVIDDLPYQFTKPLAITGNTELHKNLGDNSIVVWTDWKTKAGDAIIVPIRIDIKGQVGLYNNVNSVFNAYDQNYINDLLRDSNILYTENNRDIHELLNAQGREVPESQALNVSMDRIAHTEKKSNTSKEKNQDRNDYSFDVIRQKQEELNSLRQQKKTIIESAEYKDLVNKVVNGENIFELAEFEKSSGLKDIALKAEQLQKEISEYSKAYMKQQEQKAIADDEANREKSGLSEADYRRKLAVNQLGTTPYFYDAGYIMPNGKMLNLSGTKNRHNGARGDDHRIIGTVYPGNYSGWGAVTKFMSDGNIRIMPESPGLDIISTKKPSKQQYDMIKRFIEETKGKGYFAVDFTDENGKHIGNIEYKGKFTADGVISDIQRYYNEGELTKPSHLNEFRYQDRDYLSAVERGDMETAQRMVDEAAKAAGYSADFSWRMDHKAPDSVNGVRLDQIDRAYNRDGSIYSAHAAYYYGDGRTYDNKAIAAIRKARNSPNAIVSIYRAVPTHIADTRIRNGDWVTIDREYAEEHGWRMFDDAYRIIENKVPAKYLFTDGSSIHEFGYDNGNPNEVYKNTKNNVKLATVTYDDDGKVIPLSERFKTGNADIRYQARIYGIPSNSVFPPYNVSQSDANEWATRWAHHPDVEAGDQRLASYHGRWYIIEKFDDTPLKYMIVEHVRAKDVEKIRKQLEEQHDRRIEERMARRYNEVDSLYRGKTQNGGERFDSNGIVPEYSEQGEEVLGLGKSKDGGRQDPVNTDEGALGSDENRQGNGTARLKSQDRTDDFDDFSMLGNEWFEDDLVDAEAPLSQIILLKNTFVI